MIIPPLPDKQYKTLVVDPPWQIKKIKRQVRPNQSGFDYPTLSVDEIKSLPLPIADDAFVFLWTTHKYLPHAFGVLQAWELTYRFTMTWHKNGGIQVFNSAQWNSEFVLVGTKGNPKLVSQKQFFTAFNAKRQGHSVKPDEFYQTIRRVSPSPRIDMFARRRIGGFDAWGNEIENDPAT